MVCGQYIGFIQTNLNTSILTFPDIEYIKKFNKVILNFIWNKRDRVLLEQFTRRFI